MVNHPNWLTFVRSNISETDYPRVVAYINIRLSSFCFSLRKDIIDHRDILLILFFNKGDLFWLMNVYSDSSHSALKYLKNTEVNLRNLLIMTGDFNIRDSLWNSSFPHHLSISDNLIIIADSLDLSLSIPTNQTPTRYTDNINEPNLTIDLMFIQCDSPVLNNHTIHSEWWLSSDHTSLTVTISISEEVIITRKNNIKKDSNEETQFLKDTVNTLKNLNILSITDLHMLENIVNKLAINMEEVWNWNAKPTNITKHSKSWWDYNCNRELEKYRTSKSLKDWKSFRKTVKNTKRMFFDLKIKKIANQRKEPWELMNWVNKRKLPVLEAIKFNSQPCLKLDDLWQALHSTFNTAQLRIIDCDVLDELRLFLSLIWTHFTKEEFISSLTKYNGSSIPRSNKLSWRHFKIILKDSTCLKNVISIANACIDLGHWPSHFKISSTVIIPKPNKTSYDSPKAFRPIILLNMLGKLIEKVISDKLQLHMVSNNFIHHCQLGGLKFKSMTDAGVALTHFIRTGWVRNLSTSTLTFDISQFFPSLNHHLLCLILKKAGLDFNVI